MEEKTQKLEKELVEIYEQENKDLESELIELLKETEENAFKLREQIVENKRFIKVMKSRWEDKQETE